MFGRKKTKKKKRKSRGITWWSELDGEQRGRLMRRGILLVLALSVVFGGSIVVSRLEAAVMARVKDRVDAPVLTFLDLPPAMAPLAEADLRRSVADLMTKDWLDDGLCQAMATRLSDVGWVEALAFVRRTADARFEVSARFRQPVAMAQLGGAFLLVDSQGVRLPGSYLYDPHWKVIQGLGHGPAQPGEKWEGDDVAAGLTLIDALEREPFGDQITGVIVDNYRGRQDSARSHVELATDRAAGSRIRWGSAPGLEIEENSVEEKMAILRANYRETGRADAHHPLIDVSTYPDRYTVPG